MVKKAQFLALINLDVRVPSSLKNLACNFSSGVELISEVLCVLLSKTELKFFVGFFDIVFYFIRVGLVSAPIAFSVLIGVVSDPTATSGDTYVSAFVCVSVDIPEYIEP